MTTKTFAPKSTALSASPNDKAQEKLTTVRDKSRSSTGTLPPLGVRLTPNDRSIAAAWMTELEEITEKKVTLSKLIRGLLNMKGQIDNEELLLSILKNT